MPKTCNQMLTIAALKWHQFQSSEFRGAASTAKNAR
jgi:hypothetical protein